VRRYPNLMARSSSVIAMGMLEILVPDAMVALGFVRGEPVEGLFCRENSETHDVLIKFRFVRCDLAIDLFEC